MIVDRRRKLKNYNPKTSNPQLVTRNSKKNMKKIIAIAAILVSVTLTVNAQPGSTTGGFDDDPVDVPLDGGIILLAAVGAAYGFKKLKKNI